MELFSELQERIPAWRSAELTVSPLLGGITNQNYKVQVGDAAFVVRVCAQGVAVHGIDRQIEQQCNRAAATIGVSPEVVGFFTGLPGAVEVLVTRHIAGDPLNAAQVRQPAQLHRIAALLQRYHGLTDFAGNFDAFAVIERGLAACRAMNAPLPALLPEVETALAQLQTALHQQPPPPTACHNDLLPANFVAEPDGRIWLVDWEYAGWGDPFFDLGNLAVNNEFSDVEDEALLLAYFGAVTPEQWARLKLMKILSDAREGVWGLVQWGISQLEFDFAAYGARHLARFMQQYSTPQVALWLAAVA